MDTVSDINPRPFLEEITRKQIIVRLKWGWELRGVLKSSDQYMNLHMLNTEEYVDGKSRGILGEVLVRCNNVLYIRQCPDEK
ncbi:unnamed protein product [Paramecium primaurelia]|uniref:Sm protein F n=5 Tax=Paramecium TaxID=5884 RepID=A0D257_PARTE|nr:uncharacterized protein GSPATT00012630001 [Paramecium tetraurelia]XP_001445292.1 uncharacterized protein GSPATT00013361001 [Paramecium tetraurelia]CAD8058213.1 unnamed protein product [Paramecium primaurelia]CAD8069926.1 unnamed protein product [Paramecium sonneborni]CAD8145326.1 unnamed protein product [Paramecium octaurelia]CAD8153461.1 unnamed protein product [Paramecium pentaurelia]CAD8067956.1 unnamed protein product [Paramecium primaurelia]|eukprot:XP_001444521.1 hypothetical protein (macronuclear) [Paramecium tetraurelia strain d4-2]